ncbi:hypothetical protein [Holospora curviuscula]|uniref:Biotin transporter n=1 Tax=Holospora curviuscula TaxID=1082868 RepID=A0A2S5R9C1_9PROT|nr:hypothetical protein [Holospora curviuscula]PPE03802.1 hypothetical protein HCUR_00817 [Holospora curviuscula]
MIKLLLGILKGLVFLTIAGWIQIPFSPLSWNVLYFATISLLHWFQGGRGLNIVLIWLALGSAKCFWICPMSSLVLSSPGGGYIWGILPALFWAQQYYQCKAWVKWGGSLLILEACGAAQCILSTPNLDIAKQYGLLALFPWNLFQCMLGIRYDQRIKRILDQFFFFQNTALKVKKE